MGKLWYGIVLITILPAIVLAHVVLWPPCTDNTETILEAGFIIYSKKEFKDLQILGIRQFFRDCRIRTMRPNSLQISTRPNGTYLAANSSITDVDNFLKHCPCFETLYLYEDDADSIFESSSDFEDLLKPPEGCDSCFDTTMFMGTMETIILSDNKIHMMRDPEIFLPFEELQDLNLNSNMIVSMHEDIFKTLTNIHVLTLSQNKIERLPERLFQGLGKLEQVDLSYNYIEYVPVKSFHGTALIKLDLSYNKIKYLPEYFFLDAEGVKNSIKLFYFDCNPWSCGCLNELLLEIKQLGINYRSNKYNGENPVCLIDDTRSLKCNRKLYEEYESNQCPTFGKQLLAGDKALH